MKREWDMYWKVCTPNFSPVARTPLRAVEAVKAAGSLVGLVLAGSGCCEAQMKFQIMQLMFM